MKGHLTVGQRFWTPEIQSLSPNLCLPLILRLAGLRHGPGQLRLQAIKRLTIPRKGSNIINLLFEL